VAGPNGGADKATDFGSGVFLTKTSPGSDLQSSQTTITVAGWVKLDAKPAGAGAQQPFWAQIVNDIPDSGFNVYYDPTSDRFALDVDAGDNAVLNQGSLILDSTLGSPAIGTWYNIISELDINNNRSTISINNKTPSVLQNILQPLPVAGKVGNGSQFQLNPTASFYTRTSGWDFPPTVSGNDHASMVANADVSIGNNSKTVWGWFKTTDPSPPQTMMGSWLGDAPTTDWIIQIGSNEVWWVLGHDLALTTVPISDTNWHLVVAWFDKDANQMYLNLDHGAQTSVHAGPTFPATSTVLVAGATAQDGVRNSQQFLGTLNAWGIASGTPTQADLDTLWNNGNGYAYTYTIGGTISGLSGTVVLQNNGGDNYSTSTNSSFVFASSLNDGHNYSVTVSTQPTEQTCSVTNGSGTISSANVTNVSVSCANTTKAITTFDFNGLTPAVVGSVNETNKTISLTVPYGTADTALVPTITTTGLSVSPASLVAQNFSSPAIYTVTAANASTQPYTVTVTIAPIGTHTITASAGANGSITPSGSVLVNNGADQSFTITPSFGYHIDTVTADGSSVSATSPYTFTDVTADHTISATFAADSVSTPAPTPENTDENNDDNQDLNIHNIKAESTEDSITITWKTDHNTKSTIRYGIDRNLKEKRKDNQKEKKHTVVLKKLLPDTKYYFRIKATDSDDNEDSSSIHSVMTKSIPTSNSNLNTNSNENTNQLSTPTENTAAPSYSGNSSPSVCSYTVEAGDTLWSIAKKVYGDATAYTLIIDKNKDKYTDIESKLSIGQELIFCDNNPKSQTTGNNSNTDNSGQQSQSQNQTQSQPKTRTFHWWNPFTWF
jgi:nucleoid-associated protein YgaU